MIRGRTRDTTGMDKHVIADFKIRCIPVELESKRLFFRNDAGGANRSEIVDPELQPAVIEQVCQILIGLPLFSLHKTRESTEVFQFWSLSGGRTVTDNVRG